MTMEPATRATAIPHGSVRLPAARHGGTPRGERRAGSPRMGKGMALATGSRLNLPAIIAARRVAPTGACPPTPSSAVNAGQAATPEATSPAQPRRTVTASGVDTEATGAERRTAARARPSFPEATEVTSLRPLASTRATKEPFRPSSIAGSSVRVPVAAPQIGKETRAPTSARTAAGTSEVAADGAGPVRHGPATAQTAAATVPLIIQSGVTAAKRPTAPQA